MFFAHIWGISFLSTPRRWHFRPSVGPLQNQGQEPRFWILSSGGWASLLALPSGLWPRVLSCRGFSQSPYYLLLLFLLFVMHRSIPQIVGSLARVKGDLPVVEEIQLIHTFLLKAIVYSLASFREKQATYERKFNVLMAFLYLWAKKPTSVFSKILMSQHKFIQWAFLSVFVLGTYEIRYSFKVVFTTLLCSINGDI